MSASKDGKITACQVLAPVSLLALVLFLFTLSQTVVTFQIRDALHQAKEQQTKPLEDVQKVQTQLDALALGTKRLASQGNKSAQAIISGLKQAGITIKGDEPPAARPAMPSSNPAMATPATESTDTP